ncbi:cytochrome P450 [Agromyces sp. NPDC057865]|uniref:cytochrome P450 n=1 Tax=Agromyces sp. NPDC057865 TaxID=3346267 RepID=UPI00366BBA3E
MDLPQTTTEPTSYVHDRETADDSLAFLRDGYAYGTRRFERFGTDAFRTRLLGRPTVVVHGREAAAMFYDPRSMTRAGAIPTSVAHLLQDDGSVQTLEDAAHDHRKAAFLRLLGDAEAARMAEASGRAWAAAAAREAGRTRSLYDLGVEVLTRAALEWTGLPAGSADPRRLAGPLAEMVDAAARVGPRNWIARLRRRRVERWAEAVLGMVRDGELEVPAGSPISVVAGLHDHDGSQPPLDIAAVELINLLRPIVAVARYVAFTGHALERHPHWRETLRGDAAARHRFVQEVRRFYPFFPVIAGTVRRGFTWREHEFEVGKRVVLDLYATNHDERIWTHPGRFDPDRFITWVYDPDALVPQGGGDAATGHRCPGEGATIALMERFLEFATADPAPYTVPPQDLRISLRRIPALPQDRMLVTLAE